MKSRCRQFQTDRVCEDAKRRLVRCLFPCLAFLAGGPALSQEVPAASENLRCARLAFGDRLKGLITTKNKRVLRGREGDRWAEESRNPYRRMNPSMQSLASEEGFAWPGAAPSSRHGPARIPQLKTHTRRWKIPIPRLCSGRPGDMAEVCVAWFSQSHIAQKEHMRAEAAVPMCIRGSRGHKDSRTKCCRTRVDPRADEHARAHASNPRNPRTLATHAPRHPRAHAPTHPRTHAPTHPCAHTHKTSIMKSIKCMQASIDLDRSA